MAALKQEIVMKLFRCITKLLAFRGLEDRSRENVMDQA